MCRMRAHSAKVRARAEQISGPFLRGIAGACAALGVLAGSACSDLQGESPVALPAGYAYGGATGLVKNDGGTYTLTWSPPPLKDASYSVFARRADEPMNWDEPVHTTRDLSYTTADLRFGAQWCFAVRFTSPLYDKDRNTTELCSDQDGDVFAGARTLRRLPSGLFELTWDSVPLPGASYGVFEATPASGASGETVTVSGGPVRKLKDTRALLGPFSLGDVRCFVVRCFVVRLLSDRLVEPDSNTNALCTDENQLSGFSGITQAASDRHAEVALSWEAAQSPDVIGYFVYEGADFSKTVQRVGSRLETFLRLEDLEPFEEKTYGIRAITRYGTEDSNTRVMTVRVRGEFPLPFGGLQGARVVSPTRIELSWEPLPYVSEYRIYRGVARLGGKPVVDYEAPFASVGAAAFAETGVHVVSGLGDDTRYAFAVRAVSLFEVEDANTKEMVIDTPDDQGQPPRFAGIKSATLRDGRIVLTWEPAVGEVSRYRVYKAEGRADSFSEKRQEQPPEPGSATSTSLSGFRNGKDYTFLVLAEDRHGNLSSNDAFATVTAKSQTLPVFYGYTRAKGIDEGRVELVFKATPDANVDQYTIQVREKGQTAWLETFYVAQDLTRKELTFVADGLKVSTEYEFLARAVDRWGNSSENTLTIGAKTLDLSPPSFAGVTEAFQPVGESQVLVRWNPSVTRDVDHYRVYRSVDPIPASDVHYLRSSASSSLPDRVWVSDAVAGADSELRFDGLSKGQTYYFLVRAFDLYGNEDTNAVQVSATVRNTYPVLNADRLIISAPEGAINEPIELTASDPDLSDELTIRVSTTTCNATLTPLTLLQDARVGLTRKATLRWSAPADYIDIGKASRTCHATVEVFDGEAQSAPLQIQFTAENRKPTGVTAAIPRPPAGYLRNQVLTCSPAGTDPDGSALTYSYTWLKNDNTLSGVVTSTLTPAQANYLPGDVVRCSVSASDGHESVSAVSDPVTMGNVAPDLLTAYLREDGGSAPLRVGDRVSCAWSGRDLDGDSISVGALTVEASQDGTTWSQTALQETACDLVEAQKRCFAVDASLRRKQLRCAVASATDGYLKVEAPFFSAPVTVSNSNPTLSNVRIPTGTGTLGAGDLLTCEYDFSDPDNDALTSNVQFSWLRGGVLIPTALQRTYKLVLADRSEPVQCEVTLLANADGFGSAQVGPIRSAGVTYNNSNPSVSDIHITPDAAVTGTTLTCNYTLGDPGGDTVINTPTFVKIQWYVNDGTANGPILGADDLTYTVLSGDRSKAITCQVALAAGADGAGSAAVAARTSQNTVTPVNSNPVVNSVTLTSSATPARTGTVLTCASTVSDPDGDPFALLPTYSWRASGNVITGAASGTYTVKRTDRGKDVRCAVGLPADADGKGSTAVASVTSPVGFTPVNTDPEIADVTVNSVLAGPYRVGDTFTCVAGTFRDADQDSIAPVYAWYADDVLIPGAVFNAFTATAAERNKLLKCSYALPSGDGAGSAPVLVMSSNARQVQNQAPLGTFKPSLVPVSGGTLRFNSTVECRIPVTGVPDPIDPDGDTVTFRYVWKRNGAFLSGTDDTGTVSNSRSLTGQVSVGDVITCELRISDGISSVNSLVSTAVSVVNLDPVVTGLPAIGPGTIYNSGKTTTLTCTPPGSVSDPEGTALTYEYRFWRNDRTTTTVWTALYEGSGLAWASSNSLSAGAPSGPQTWNPNHDVRCEVRVSDANGGSLSFDSPTVSVQNSVPVGTFTCNGGDLTLIGNPGDSIADTSGCTRSGVVDDDGDDLTFDFDYDPAQTTCPGAGGTLTVHPVTGVVSGLSPDSNCKISLVLVDARGDATVDTFGSVVRQTFQFYVPYSVSFGDPSVNGSCRLTLPTRFTAGLAGFQSSSFTASALGLNAVHNNPGSPTGSIDMDLDPNLGGGDLVVTWSMSGSDGSSTFTNTLTRTLKIEPNPATGGIGQLQPQTGQQPAPSVSGLPASSAQCPLGNCSGRLASLAAGYDSTCAVAEGGDVYCWGSNDLGQLGTGVYGNPTPFDSSPAQLVDLGTYKARTVAAGGDLISSSSFACAIVEDPVNSNQNNGVYCWGSNQRGQLGRGSFFSIAPFGSAVPAQVSGISGGTGASEIVSVGVGAAHACALTKGLSSAGGGGIKCWGANSKGQLGDGSRQDRAVPVSVIQFGSSGAVALATGGAHTCAITNVRRVKCWGANDRNQLGVPIAKFDEPWNLTPVEIPGLEDVVAIAAGGAHTCALRANGDVKCWGSIDYGQVGTGSIGLSIAAPAPTLGGVVSDAVAITAGGQHTCALKRNGSVQCWGKNLNKQIGNQGLLDWYTTPQAVYNVNNAALAVSAGTDHTCILMNNQNLSCFGSNVSYRLGLSPTGQNYPQNRVMPDTLQSPAVPGVQILNCPELRVYRGDE